MEERKRERSWIVRVCVKGLVKEVKDKTAGEKEMTRIKVICEKNKAER